MITVVWQDERGGELAEFPDYAIVNECLGLAGDAPATCCLQFIDRYGNTTFNQLQLPVLIAEFTTVRSATTDPQVRRRLDALIAFLQDAVDATHTYIKFIGD